MSTDTHRGRRVAAAATLLAVSALAGAASSLPAHAAGVGEGSSRAWPYWKTDLHAHSVVSGDATADSGIIADAAKGYGFNAVFLTDHQAGNFSPIGGVIASHVSFEDDSGANRQWEDVPKTPSATATAGLSQEHVLNGTNSYQSSVTGTGEAFGSIKRGPSLRSGQITLRFSVFPTRVDPGGGLYVSASLGGDATVPGRESDGYTTADGTVMPDHSTTLVWQLGTPRVDSDNGTTRVLTKPLAYTLNTWNTYTIDVTDAVNQAFPDPAKRPQDLNAILFVKMAAASRTGGTETGYFDSLSMDAANASTKAAAASAATASDFVKRNQSIHSWDTSTFLLNPGLEMGFNDHAQRLHFPITDPAQWQQFPKGVDGIGTVQASGYPAQLNHPGLPGGVTDDEAISNNAYGADVMEADERGTNDVMIRDWDALLSTGEPLIGTWTSDSHRNATFGPSTFLQSPVLTEPALLQSLFEGRAFLAPVGFPGKASFSPDSDGGSYPARYPVYRSASDSAGTVNLSITDGLSTGQKVVWIQNGVVVRSDDVQGSSYQGTIVLPLPSSSTPVRAEVRAADGHRALMTEPIMMRTAASLPHGLTVHLERVTTPSGAGFTKTMVKGITAVAFDAPSSTLTTTVQDPAGSTVEQVVGIGSFQPQSVRIDGTTLPAVASRSALEAGSADGWAFDGTQHQLVVKATHSGGSGSLAITLEAGPDTSPPSVPQLSAVAQDAKHVALRWPSSTDDTGVTRYTVSRNGAVLALLNASATGYDDTTVSPDTTYSYAVTAEDSAQNVSAPGTATVHTQPIMTASVTPSADTYALSTSPSVNFGTAKSFKADATPDTTSFLRFPLPANAGRVVSATVGLTASAALPGGVQLRSLTDHGWGEKTLTYANAPVQGAVVGTTGKILASTPVSTDISAYAATVPAGGSLDLGITNPSGTNVSFFAKENGVSGPTLSLLTSTVAPTAGDVTVTTPEDTPASFTPRAAGGAGPLTCSIDNPPASGSAWIAADCSSGQINPSTNWDGTDSFTYVVTDGTQSASGRVTFSTTAVNDAPTTDAEVLGAGTDQNTPVTLTLRGNDVDGDCPLSFAIVAAPEHGTLGSLSAASCATGSATATVSYTPDTNYAGNDSLSFTVSDAAPASSAPAAINISVAPVAGAPTAGPVTFTATAGVGTSWTPVVGGGAGPLTCGIGTAPTKGTATVAADCSSGTYTAAASSVGRDSFSYTVTDGTATTAGGASVTITAATRPPTAADGSLDTAQRAQVSVPLSGNDPDGTCPMTFTLLSAPTHGALGTPAASSCLTGVGSSNVLYTPAEAYAGPDSFSYQVTDGQGETSAPATITITVTPPLFADGFESGALAAWTRTAGAVVRTATPRTGTFELDVDSTSGGPAYARRTLGGTLTSTDSSAGIRLLTAPASGATALLRLKAADDTALVTVSMDTAGRLKLRNEIAKVAWSSTTALPVGAWSLVSVRITTAGASSTLQVFLNGVAVPGLSVTSDLSTYRVGAVQIGDNTKGPTGHALFDDVRVTGS
jgi:hypothetical protein